MFRPHIFRALFQKDIGGVAGVSDSWFDADLYNVDGGSGKVRSFANYIDQTQILDQANNALQAAIPVGDPAINNRSCTIFTGGIRYRSTAASSSWRFCSDGTGCEIFVGSIPNDAAGVWVFLSTGASGGPGLALYTVTGTTYILLSNNSGGNVINTSIGSYTVGNGTYINNSYTNPNWRIAYRTLAPVTGVAAAVPYVGDPQGPLMLGANYAGGQPAVNWKWSFLYAFRRSLTSATRAISQEYIRSITGVF
jgi:hypothetical protein